MGTVIKNSGGLAWHLTQEELERIALELNRHTDAEVCYALVPDGKGGHERRVVDVRPLLADKADTPAIVEKQP